MTTGARSLSIAQGKDGRTLLHCFAKGETGCSASAIVRALGLEVSDLFDDGPRTRRVTKSFVYSDDNEKPVARIDRVEPAFNGARKAFLPYLADGPGGFKEEAGLDGATLPLYRLHEVRAAVTADEVIFLTEGEGKGDRLLTALHESGLSAAVTTIAGGARAHFQEEHVQSLAGATKVIVLADSDASGRSAAKSRAQRIADAVAACDVRVVDFFLIATTAQTSRNGLRKATG